MCARGCVYARAAVLMHTDGCVYMGVRQCAEGSPFGKGFGDQEGRQNEAPK